MKRQPSVQDVTWFIDLHERGRLDLNPPYQRRSVWTPKDRKFFLDTIFRNYPCPPVFLHKVTDDNGVTTYHVVDGKQRLETILLFASNKIAMDKEYGDARLDGLRFKKIPLEMKRKFWDYSVPVDFMEVEGLDINEVFDRVNRNSRNLERQELRHARYDGWFINEVESEADEDDFWVFIKVTSRAKAKRMKNVQLVSELMLIVIEQKIIGFNQDYLDDRYAHFDSIESEDDDIDFDLEAYQENKSRLKTFIRAMEEHNHCISEVAKTNYNLYTLFAFVILNEMKMTANETAEAYVAFMDVVETFRQAEDAEQLLDNNQDKPDNWENAFRYYKSTRGANTDLPQREERLNSLTDALLGEV